MRKGNVTILASILAIALVASGVGMGTMAYFTDLETAKTGQITAGTLDMKIGKTYGGTYGDAPIDLGNIIGLSPGKQFTLEVWLSNEGNLDAQYVFMRFCELKESDAGFAQKLKLVKVEDYDWQGYWFTTWYTKDPLATPPTNEAYADPNVWLNFWYGTPYTTPRKSYITLYDLVYLANPGGTDTATGLFFYNGDGTLAAPAFLPAQAKSGIKITFELMWETKNEYQGDWASFRMDFIGSQGKDNIADYITETLGALEG
jgi:predicted ribosomally synthesized peptide with SipW-like signal peptide